MRSRRNRSRSNNLAGRAAEHSVARWYEAAGYKILARRWRGSGAELDLVACGTQEGPEAGLVFIEVKRGSSHGKAITHLRPAQITRISGAAQEYIASHASNPLCDMRFDLALVNEWGEVRVLENALAQGGAAPPYETPRDWGGECFT